ncbi:Hypothetical predicted protein, partial [Pelobates cultripes]
MSLLELCRGGALIPLRELLQDRKPTLIERFRYHQLTHFHDPVARQLQLTRPLLPFKDICSKGEDLHRNISLLYALLQLAEITPPMKFQSLWEEALHTLFTPQEWDEKAMYTVLSSRCARYQEINYKILTQWYDTPQKIHNYLLKTS